MTTCMIGYDLNMQGKNYDGLIAKIKDISDAFWHHLDSTWLIGHDGNAVTIREALDPYLDADDKLLVALLTKGGWASFGIKESGATWLHNHL